MDPTTLLVIACCVLAFGLVSQRIERSPLTAPMVFAAIGLVSGPAGLGWVKLDLDGNAAGTLIEVTLVLVLFTDASRIRLRELRLGYPLPARLLSLGMPLTIGLGILVARPLFPSMTWVELALLAATLAPTDAALGQSVVNSVRVPVRIRQALNVESGLNDGIAVPIVLALLAVAAAGGAGGADASEPARTSVNGLQLAFAHIGLGPVAGLAVAWPAGWLVQRAVTSKSIVLAYEHIAGVAIAIGAFGTAELIGGNGFIAAFTAGLVIGNTTRTVRERLQEFAEGEGQLLALLAFLVFGAAMLPPALESLDGATALYIALSLTVVRMVPVALALAGTGLRGRTVGFIGWFGPRGLATILFALLVEEDASVPHHARLFDIATLAIAASILAHGFSAAPLSKAYGEWVSRLREKEPEGPESQVVPELPVRIRTHAQRRAGALGGQGS